MPGLKAAIVPVTPFQQNCAIVFDEASKRGAVVDPGGEVERILEAVGQAGRDASSRSCSPTGTSTMPAGRRPCARR